MDLTLLPPLSRLLHRLFQAPWAPWLLLLALLDLLTTTAFPLAVFFLVPVLLAAGLHPLRRTRALGGAALLLALGIALVQGVLNTPLVWLFLLAMATIVGLALLLNRERLQLEGHYRLLAENAADVVFSATLQGETEGVSASIEPLTGWRPADLIGRPFAPFVHPGDLPALMEADAAFRRGETHRFEMRVRCRGGGYTPVGVTGRGLRSPAGAVTAIVGSWRDVRSERLGRLALERSLHLQGMADTIQEAAVGMCICAPGTGTFRQVNPALCRFFGYSEQELLQQNWQHLIHPADLAKDEALAAQVLAGTLSSYRLRKRFLHRDGSVLWGDLSVSCRRDSQGQVVEVIAQILDVTAQVEAESQLLQEAQLHPLTGALNRRGLEEHLAALQEGRRRSDLPLACLFCDIDHFKTINDQQGHPAGDQVLQVVACRLRGAIRQGDRLARFGGDELVLLLEPVGAPEDPAAGDWLLALAEKIRRLVAEPIPLDQGSIDVTLSIGLAQGQPGETPQELLARADAALYEAKRAGRNCVAVASGIPAQP